MDERAGLGQNDDAAGGGTKREENETGYGEANSSTKSIRGKPKSFRFILESSPPKSILPPQKSPLLWKRVQDRLKNNSANVKSLISSNSVRLSRKRFASGRIRETRGARFVPFEKDDKSERAPVYLPVRSRESKRNIVGFISPGFGDRRHEAVIRAFPLETPPSLLPN
uniref:Uncharacterized protein n=1 Tax=Vespula pensylvanica TaxID=30213 RepID=A0A834JFR1_VESPE|nr:hypothetical protein H0235_018271 [Vespula pensylvanica]